MGEFGESDADDVTDRLPAVAGGFQL